jgi:AcrR family transcriptional regulator
MPALRTREKQKNARRRTILEAARTLIRERKSDDFSMPMLAERAGVSLVTPYNLFGSKSNILLEIVREDVFERTAEIEHLPVTTLAAWVSEIAQVLARLYYANRHFYRLLIVAIASSANAEAQRELLAMYYRMFEKAMERLMAENKLLRIVTANTLAGYLAHAISGALQERLMERGTEEKLKVALEKGVLLIFAGVCPVDARPELLARLAALEAK